MAGGGLLKKKERKGKKQSLQFAIDCHLPIEDNVFFIEDFETFLKQKIKVNGKAGNLGNTVQLTHDKNTISVTAEAPFAKRYLKYLTKKYLKKQQLRDFLHVVSSNKGSYELRYFNIQNEEEE